MPRNKVVWRRPVFVILILASLALLTVSFRETDSGPVHAIQEAGAGLLSPLQSWGSTIAEPFQDGYQWLKTLWSAHQRAERLEKELQILQGEAIKLEEQAEENQRLRALLDLHPDRGIYPEGTDFTSAHVIGRSPTRWQAWILVDKGSADGLRVGLPVVGATPVAGESLAGKGLVGKIVAVTERTAKVQLIIDADSSVAAKIQGSRAEGIVEGSMTGSLIMDYVDRDIAVDPKLVIVTSGYGGVYPADIPVGIVTSVGEKDVNIYKEIEVRAFVDFRILEEVMVLILPDETGSTTTPGGPTGTPGGSTGTPGGPNTAPSPTATTVTTGVPAATSTTGAGAATAGTTTTTGSNAPGRLP